jgi:hypothetical protein
LEQRTSSCGVVTVKFHLEIGYLTCPSTGHGPSPASLDEYCAPNSHYVVWLLAAAACSAIELELSVELNPKHNIST